MAATEPVQSTGGRWVGGVSIKARDLAAEVLEVIGTDGEFEHLVDDGEKVSQRANRAEGQSMGRAEESA